MEEKSSKMAPLVEALTTEIDAVKSIIFIIFHHGMMD